MSPLKIDDESVGIDDSGVGVAGGSGLGIWAKKNAYFKWSTLLNDIFSHVVNDLFHSSLRKCNGY